LDIALTVAVGLTVIAIDWELPEHPLSEGVIEYVNVAMELGVILVSRIAGIGFAVPLVVDGDSPARGDEVADQE